ncbi:MAG: DNA helicase RecQ [Balneolaceae bacterium]|nr:MAG: DNA helicase RecQ [Balneolaceae bacterium]
MTIEKAGQILQETFGYNSFRPLQQEIISNVLAQKDSLVIMPTGGGKSLCYQIPSMLFPGLTIVISPLISLMKDQVEQLSEVGIPALFLNSTLSKEQYQVNVARIRSGDVKLLYLAPETLMMAKTRKLLEELTIDCFTIDEAHCISEWGHDFRPEYRQLAQVRKDFPNSVCLALTATATPRVQEDIRSSLEMEKSEVFVASFDRKNLILKIADKQKPLEQILDFLYTRKRESGIIYCFSRRQVDELAYDLKQQGYSVLPYHAGLAEQERSDHQDAFIRDRIQIIVATVAFGMGINKPDVRFVIHHDMPQNIESYYQQIGRAGRDGRTADCLLLYSYSDRQKIQYFIGQKEGDEKEIAEKHLEDLIGYLETQQCRRKPLMNYFGEEYTESECGMCDNCLREKGDLEDYTTEARKYLSTVVRSGQRFGAHHIADILRGSSAKKILENNHDQLTTYGIGKEWSKDQWIQLSRLLIRSGYLKKDPDHGSLILTEESESLLRGGASLLGILDRTQTASGAAGGRRGESEIEKKYDEFLFEELRKKRKELAEKLEVPPYVIFPDTTLMEMSYYYPQSEEMLPGIYGVGSAKLKKYGKDFLRVIRTYCEGKKIDDRAGVLVNKVKKTTSGKKYEQVGQAFEQGKGVLELAEEHGVKTATILSHLKSWLDDGNPLEKERIVVLSGLSERKQHEVFKVFDLVGADVLKHAYEELNKSVDYNELRILQLAYQAGHS